MFYEINFILKIHKYIYVQTQYSVYILYHEDVMVVWGEGQYDTFVHFLLPGL